MPCAHRLLRCRMGQDSRVANRAARARRASTRSGPHVLGRVQLARLWYTRASLPGRFRSPGSPARADSTSASDAPITPGSRGFCDPERQMDAPAGQTEARPAPGPAAADVELPPEL